MNLATEKNRDAYIYSASQPHCVWRTILCSCILLLIHFAANAIAVADDANTAVDRTEFEIGFAGTAKLGVWQPFLVRTSDQLEPKTFELTVLDGDDTPVTYVGTLRPIGADLNLHQGWLKLGRNFGTVKLKLQDLHGLKVFEKEFPIGRSGEGGRLSVVRSTGRLILSLEPADVLAQAIDSTSVVVGSVESKVISLDSTEQLALDWFCYEGVDTVVLVTADLARINRISERQWRALEQWVENGGRLIFSVAQHGAELLETNGILHRFCPGHFSGAGEMLSSGRLESFANSGQLIKRGESPIRISLLDDVEGVVELKQDEHALITRQSRGFGEIVFVAFDLDDPRISQWDGFSGLVQRLERGVDIQEAAQAQMADMHGGSVSHYGYDDLIGQLRVPLERFSGVRFVAFTWIAVLIGLYILCIGPGDYFLLKKLFGRMELTWITFPLVTLLFCGLAYAISRYTRPAEIQLNQLEIVDIDAVSSLVRGTIWSNLYSPSAGSCVIEPDPQKNGLGIKPGSYFISWQGLPGDGLGGMQTKITSPIIRSGYRQAIDSREEAGAYRSKLTKVPQYVSATKPLFTRWNGHFDDPIRSRLLLSNSSGRLEGTLANPLEMPLTNVRLFFENYAYVLRKQRLEPGETIDVVTETKERTVRSLLTRRERKSDDETKTQNSPWDPAETRMARIADLLMFYGAAGGNNYTGLTHGYQNFIDLSDQLNLKRAILVGQVESLGTELLIDDQSVSGQHDQVNTIVRIGLPVEYETK